LDPKEFTPKLRIVPVPVEIEGKKMLIFQDPDQITDETVVMPFEAGMLVQYFDGSKTVREIQEDIMRKSGQLIDSNIISDLTNQLDERLLLDSPRFQAHMEALYTAWMELETRPPSHAGRAYPEDKDELKKFLDKFYLDPEGPGALPGDVKSNGLKGIVAPHMDISESGACTAHAFKTLAEESDAELFVIFGTGHQEPQRMFMMSEKNYETPLGTAVTDNELVKRIQRLRQNRTPVDDYIHKQEHSIEFMVVFLQHALMGKRDFKILPVLVSGMHPSIMSELSPLIDPIFREFSSAMKQAIAESGQKVCFIAGADLAHQGPRYGNKEAWGPARMGEEEKLDRGMLGPLLTGDKDGFFMDIAKIKDQRSICGVGPVYSMYEMTAPEKSELIKWGYWHDAETHSVVTFVSMSLY
jgi:MEMO1 family protein